MASGFEGIKDDFKRLNKSIAKVLDHLGMEKAKRDIEHQLSFHEKMESAGVPQNKIEKFIRENPFLASSYDIIEGYAAGYGSIGQMPDEAVQAALEEILEVQYVASVTNDPEKLGQLGFTPKPFHVHVLNGVKDNVYSDARDLLYIFWGVVGKSVNSIHETEYFKEDEIRFDAAKERLIKNIEDTCSAYISDPISTTTEKARQLRELAIDTFDQASEIPVLIELGDEEEAGERLGDFMTDFAKIFVGAKAVQTGARALRGGATLAKGHNLNARSDWPKISGMLRDAVRGKGDFTIGSATREQANAMGKAWVGEGYKVSSNGKAWVSADGTRQYRMPTYKPNLSKTQANLEWRPPGGKSKKWQSNAHINIGD